MRGFLIESNSIVAIKGTLYGYFAGLPMGTTIVEAGALGSTFRSPASV